MQGTRGEENPMEVPTQAEALHAPGECRAKKACYLGISGFHHWSKIPNTWIQASATNETTGWRDCEFSITAATRSPALPPADAKLTSESVNGRGGLTDLVWRAYRTSAHQPQGPQSAFEEVERHSGRGARSELCPQMDARCVVISVDLRCLPKLFRFKSVVRPFNPRLSTKASG